MFKNALTIFAAIFFLFGTYQAYSLGDTDGVHGDVENAAPNGGDANGDGTEDATQNDVASIPTDAGYVCIDANGADLSNVSVFNFEGAEKNVFPFGRVTYDFSVPDGAYKDIDLYWYTDLYVAADIDGFKWYGKSAPNWGAIGWHNVPYYEVPEGGGGMLAESSPMAEEIDSPDWYYTNVRDMTIGGEHCVVVTLRVTDNKLGDNNPIAGIISDPIAPFTSASSVPALGEFGGYVFAGALVFAGVWFILRKKIA